MNKKLKTSVLSLLVYTVLLPVLFPVSAFVQSNAKPLKIFILAGQSNMQGQADVSTIDYIGEDPKTAPMLLEMRDNNGKYRLVKDTWISYLTHGRGTPNGEGIGQLTVGFGARKDPAKAGGKIGPEFTFGIYMQKSLKQPILIIKTAWGGKSLHTDFRPPSAGPYEFNESEIVSIKKRGLNLEEERTKKKSATGVYYRLMVEHVKYVLSDIKRLYPDYDEEQGYEIGGFVWFQGWNDVVNSSVYPRRGQPGGYDKYSEWLAMLIRDVRRDLRSPNMPFVIGVLGTNGPIENIEKRYRAIHDTFRQAMAAPAALPEFQGNVITVHTAPYWDMVLDGIAKKRGLLNQRKRSLENKIKQGQVTRNEVANELAEIKAELASPEDSALWKRGASNAAYHYLGCAKIMALIGKGFAEAILELQVHQRNQRDQANLTGSGVTKGGEEIAGDVLARLGNAILIGFQKPNATHVAGFRTWKRLGRHVKKGERGIAIMAPIIYRKKKLEKSDNKESEDEEVRTFKTVYVFDISQTNGKPLPEFARVNGNPGIYTERLREYITSKGIMLEYSDSIGPADGVSAGGLIKLKKGLTAAEELSVLAHELAHEKLHKNWENIPKDKNVRETEAEAVAFVVCHGIGLDTNSANSDYIQLYNGDKETLMESLERIQTTASEILEAVMDKASDDKVVGG